MTRPNPVDLAWSNGVYERYTYPVVTAAHTPLAWRYDLNPRTNPFLMERLGVNAAFNSGAIELDGKICLVVRVEGWDRKSFLLSPRAPTGLILFASGTSRSVCQRRRIPTPTSMTCAW